MTYKLISTDIDDTLIPFGQEYIYQETADVFRKLTEKGILIVPNTGRGMKHVPSNLIETGIRYMICANGSAVYDLLENKKIYSAEIDYRRSIEVLRYFQGKQTPFFVFCNGSSCTDRKSFEEFRKKPTHANLVKTITVMDDLCGYLEESRNGIEKIIGVFDDSSLKTECQKEIIRQFTMLTAVSSNAFNLEVNHPDASKAIGLKKLAEYLDIPMEEVIVIGDNENDISVLKEGRYRIVPSNGTPEAKKYADVIVDDCTNNGVAKELSRIFADILSQR